MESYTTGQSKDYHAAVEQRMDYDVPPVSLGQFAASLAFGLLSILLPLAVFISMVAICVYVARRWTDRKGD